jgi:hypothetical protein
MLSLSKISILILLLFLFNGYAKGQEQDEAIFVVHSSYHDIETFKDFSSRSPV